MALTSKDGLWDRNFESYEQQELQKDTVLDDKINIEWVNDSLMKRRNAGTLIVGNGPACHTYNALFGTHFHKLATISYASNNVNVTTSQRGVPQEVIIYSNKDPSKSLSIQSLKQYGAGAVALMAQAGGFNKNQEDEIPEVVFVYAPNVASLYYYCISEFIMFHFRPREVVCLDVLPRGGYVQNYDELVLPQLRKIQTSAVVSAVEEKHQDIAMPERPFANGVDYLETGNLVSSFAASVIQQCEYTDTEGHLFVSVSDLDFLTESLISFGYILVEFCPVLSDIIGTKKQTKLRTIVSEKCADYGNKRGHLLTGRDMFC